jgi:cytochrome o ubiquinol oxidase subunit 1
LEWSTASPPPSYNYARLPAVTDRDAFWVTKHARSAEEPTAVRPSPAAGGATNGAIDVPSNSPNGFVTAFFAVVLGFALVWHIWWMAIGGGACAVLTLLVFGWIPRKERQIPVETLRANEASAAAVREGSA